MNVIEVKNLNFSYGCVPALADINFAAQKGDYIGILGPNGSGKTTLIKIILGLLKARSGKITVLNQDISKFNQWQNIGYLEQKAVPHPVMPLTAFDVARLGLLSKKSFPHLFNEEDKKTVLAALEQTSCASYKDKLFNELSGGQQQRVLLARTLVNKPSLIILDEPSTALDANSRDSFFNLISGLNKERGVTVILITHDIAEVGKYVNKLLILDKQIIFYGNKIDFCKSPAAAKYFGPYTPHLMDHLHSGESCPLGGSRCGHN